MFTNFYCVIQSSARSFNPAAFDILCRAAAKKSIIVDASKATDHRFRPLVGDVIRPSLSQYLGSAAEIEVRIYRWTGDEATTTRFKPVAALTLSPHYPAHGDGQGLEFHTYDKLVVLDDTHPDQVIRPTTMKPTRKKRRFDTTLYVEQVRFNMSKDDS